MDKYRKPAGVPMTVFTAESKVEAELRREEQKGLRQMLDVNRAEPHAFIVRPLPAPRRDLRARKKKAMEQDEFDPEWLDLVVPARSNSDLLDRMAAASSLVVDQEFENDSEDDDADYTIRQGKGKQKQKGGRAKKSKR